MVIDFELVYPVSQMALCVLCSQAKWAGNAYLMWQVAECYNNCVHLKSWVTVYLRAVPMTTTLMVMLNLIIYGWLLRKSENYRWAVTHYHSGLFEILQNMLSGNLQSQSGVTCYYQFLECKEVSLERKWKRKVVEILQITTSMWDPQLKVWLEQIPTTITWAILHGQRFLKWVATGACFCFFSMFSLMKVYVCCCQW